MTQRLEFRISNKHVALQKLSEGSCPVSDIQDYIKKIIKKHEALTPIFLIHVYINRINDRLVINIKDRCKLELQTPETMKLFGRTTKSTGKTKNGENMPSLEVFEVVLVQCN